MPDSAAAATEDFQHLVGRLRRAVTAWRSSPDDAPLVSEVREAFGAVGAHEIAQSRLDLCNLSASVINLLNRVLDGTLSCAPTVADLLDDVVAYSEGQHDAVDSIGVREPGRAAQLTERADLLASGVLPSETEADEVPPPPSVPVGVSLACSARSDSHEFRSGEHEDTLAPAADDHSRTEPPERNLLMDLRERVGSLQTDIERIRDRIDGIVADLGACLDRRSGARQTHWDDWLANATTQRVELQSWIGSLGTTMPNSAFEFVPAKPSAAPERQLGVSLAEFISPAVSWLLARLVGVASRTESARVASARKTRTVRVQAAAGEGGLDVAFDTCVDEADRCSAGQSELALQEEADAMPDWLVDRLARVGSTFRFRATRPRSIGLQLFVPTELAVLACRAFIRNGDRFLVPDAAVQRATDAPFSAPWRVHRNTHDADRSRDIGNPNMDSTDRGRLAATDSDQAVLVLRVGDQEFAVEADRLEARRAIVVPFAADDEDSVQGLYADAGGGCARLLNPAGLSPARDQSRVAK